MTNPRLRLTHTILHRLHRILQLHFQAKRKCIRCSFGLLNIGKFCASRVEHRVLLKGFRHGEWVGKETPPKTHAWIVAVHGDLAVAVFVEDGGLGATTSGPLLKQFLTAAG